jgi:hypothetical protein
MKYLQTSAFTSNMITNVGVIFITCAIHATVMTKVPPVTFCNIQCNIKYYAFENKIVNAKINCLYIRIAFTFFDSIRLKISYLLITWQQLSS